MWHIFISNKPGAVKPGTIGTVVPGFDVRVRDDLGHDLPDGEVGMLWVRGDSPSGKSCPRSSRTLTRSEEHTSELQSRPHLVCRLLLEKKKRTQTSDKHSA